MEMKMSRENWGQINKASLMVFEDYMREEFDMAEMEFGIHMDKFYRRDGLVISLDIDSRPFLPLSKGYNGPNKRVMLERRSGRFPEVLSKITRCVEPRRLFLYAGGVWVNSSSSVTGPTDCVISWSLPRESWLLRRRYSPPCVESGVRRIAS